MTGRALAEATVALLIAIFLGILGATLLGLVSGGGVSLSILDTAVRMTLGFMWLAYILWAGTVMVANVRIHSASSRKKFLIGVMISLAISVLAALAWLAFSLAVAGGWGLLLFYSSLVPTVIFFFAAVGSLAITYLILFRRDRSTN